MILAAIRTLAGAAFDAAAAFTKPPSDRLWEDAKRRCAARAADELAEREAAEEVGEPALQFVAADVPYPIAFDSSVLRSGGQTYESGPRPRISVPRPQTVAAPGAFAPPDDATTRPAPQPPQSASAGRPNVKALRVAARGLRDWTDGRPCNAVYYWRSIANALDALGVIATTNLSDQ